MATNATALAQARWIEPAARAGYVAKGIVHILIGALAITAAIGAGGAIGGGETAIRTIGQQPFGQILLVLIGVGLFAFALWRAVQAALDPDREGQDAKGVGKRVGYGVSAVVYCFLGITAFQMAFGQRAGRGGSFLDRIWSSSIGPWLIGIAGAIVVLYAAVELHRAWSAKVTEHLKTYEMDPDERRWVVRLGRAGILARAVVFIIVGLGMIRAALRVDPSEVQGVGGALHQIASQPFGIFLLVLVAAGLVAYGLYQLALARYRRIPAPT